MLITVITVNYNTGGGLSTTRDSVERQSYPHVQWVVVDGASSDDSVDRITSHGRQPDILISEPDKGIYDAMNKGIDQMRGELVVFMNAGDAFSSGSVLHDVAASYAEHRWAWAYGAVRLVTPEGDPVGLRHFTPYSHYRLSVGLAFVPHQAAYFSASLMEQLGHYDQSIGLAADVDFCARAGAVAHPHLMYDLLCNFEIGGRGHHQAPRAVPMALYAARKRRGKPLGGSAVKDLAISVAAAAHRESKAASGKAIGALKSAFLA